MWSFTTRVSAPGRIRTCDTRFRKPVLYPLSYEGNDQNSKCRDAGLGLGRAGSYEGNDQELQVRKRQSSSTSLG